MARRLKSPILSSFAARSGGISFVESGIPFTIMVKNYHGEADVYIHVYDNESCLLLDEYQRGISQVYYEVPATNTKNGDQLVIEVIVSQYACDGVTHIEYLNVIDSDPYDGPVMILPDSLTAIEEEAFEGCAAHTVVVPKDCTSIGDRAFANSDMKLRFVIVPDTVTVFGEAIFEGSAVILVCSEGSPADDYAKQNGIPVRRP